MFHDLIVDDGVEDFAYDREEGDGAVVLCEVFSFRFVDLDQLRELQGAWVSFFIYCSVAQGGEDWCKERGEVSDDCWADFEYVFGFAWVDRFHDVLDLFFACVLEREAWVCCVCCGFVCFFGVVFWL